jgi:hypothetical protein
LYITTFFSLRYYIHSQKALIHDEFEVGDAIKACESLALDSELGLFEVGAQTIILQRLFNTAITTNNTTCPDHKCPLLAGMKYAWQE